MTVNDLTNCCKVTRGDCLNERCICHTDPRHRVLTPFPMDAGPMYCCSRCSSVRRPMTNEDGTIKSGLMLAKWWHT